MASLTTVYLISIFVASVAALGSAFLGNKIMSGGDQSSPPIPEQMNLPNLNSTQIQPLSELQEPIAESNTVPEESTS